MTPKKVAFLEPTAANAGVISLMLEEYSLPYAMIDIRWVHPANDQRVRPANLFVWSNKAEFRAELEAEFGARIARAKLLNTTTQGSPECDRDEALIWLRRNAAIASSEVMA